LTTIKAKGNNGKQKISGYQTEFPWANQKIDWFDLPVRSTDPILENYDREKLLKKLNKLLK
jgi:hypothetical protein